MSAIAKPHLFFAGAVSPQNDIVIPVDWIYSMEKLALPTSVTNSTLKYYILVVLVPAGDRSTSTRRIEFANSTARDTSFTNAKTLIAASIAAS